MNFSVQERKQYFVSWGRKIRKVFENPIQYLRKPYYLKIKFRSDFYITEVTTNHPELQKFKIENIFPKTLYRVIDYNKHFSLLNLIYQLKFEAPERTHNIHLQLNSSSIVGNAELKVIETKKKYCLSLSGIKIDNTHTLLDTYLSIPNYYKETTYQIYDVLHETPLENLKSIAAILKDNNISDSNFYKFFKKTIGSSPSKILTDRKLINFIFYLIETDKVIDEYFHQFGFKDKSTLYRNFNEVFGIPPKKFKQLHNKRKHK